MFCSRCGTTMRDDAAYCPNCGATVQAGSPGVPAPGVQPHGPAGPGAPPVAYVQPETDSKAVASLVLGVLSFIFSVLTGIPAIILGHISRSEIRKSAGRLGGDGMALAGLILGYLSLAWIPVILIIIAIAIPNLMHARVAANEAAAASRVRTLNVSESTYSITYPTAGYADLATLGPGAATCQGEPNQRNACIIDDARFACPTGTTGAWCIKDGYRFSIVLPAHSGSNAAQDYVVTATPVNSGAGQRNYCSTSDMLVRYHRGSPLSAPLQSSEECQSWPPM
jgi:hypothetical protein